MNINSTHGGFIDIECSDLFRQLFILNYSEYQHHTENIATNIKTHKKTNINFILPEFSHFNSNYILFSETTQTFSKEIKNSLNPMFQL